MSFRGNGSVVISLDCGILPHLSHLLHPESLIWMHLQRHKAATKQRELCASRLLPSGAARPGGRCSEGATCYCDLLNIVICSAAATS
jgi:hypothetical protein